jgi:dienelactone hydrolase
VLAACFVIAVPGPSRAGADTARSFPDFARGPHAVGYRVRDHIDPSRTFGPRSDPQGRPLDGPFSRSVRIHLWYPADRSGAQALRYRDYILAAGDQGPDAERIDAYKAPPLRRGADERLLDDLLSRPVLAVRDAPPAPGSFPLILYAPSINADPSENAFLFEFLASHGYVVASASCVGFDEAEVSRDALGAQAQFDDIRFVLARVWDEPFVGRREIGALGFSWGGTTAVLLALQHAGVGAVASLDGGHGFAQYRSVAERFPVWSPQNLRAAFLHATPADEERDLSFCGSARYADTFVWRIPGILHRDFSADGIARFRIAASDSAAPRVCAAYEALGRFLKEFFDAYLKKDAGARSRLRDAGTSVPGSDWAYRASLPPLPTRAQFRAIIETDGVDAAAGVFHEIREADSAAVLFGEGDLLAYALEWGPDRAEDLVKLLQMSLEAYPHSADTWFWLGQALLAQEKTEEAGRAFERVLELDPHNQRAAKLLERVRAGGSPDPR